MTWPELRKPFYSLIAARIKLFITTNPPLCTDGIPATVEDQSEIWKYCYNTADGQSMAQKFRDAVKRMPK
ncbi:hypothetical protein BV898_04576 [Hypsibius exemplaris]|uniref:Uncharacterized protein n=1 Tax=Hypsibius exemplaris TaxID=2072580 RepID=A0A1W0X1J2_HYPEX|nr:hypothetical protein BV898_04576 [Hypsibius exemplaris]